MNAPRANSQLDRLQRHFADLVAAGRDLPAAPKVVDALQLGSANRFYELLRQGQEQHLWRVAHRNGVIACVYAPDGSWLVNAARTAEGKAPRVPDRKCLRCRNPFRPDHRTNFLCTTCGRYAALVA